MSENPHVANAWLKTTCPFSFKFLLFMTEAGLLDQVRVVACDPEADDFETTRSELAAATGAKASFPTVEIESGNYMTESDDLIEYFAGKNGLSVSDFPILEYYKGGLFPRVLGLHRENRQLKENLQD